MSNATVIVRFPDEDTPRNRDLATASAALALRCGCADVVLAGGPPEACPQGALHVPGESSAAVNLAAGSAESPWIVLVGAGGFLDYRRLSEILAKTPARAVTPYSGVKRIPPGGDLRNLPWEDLTLESWGFAPGGLALAMRRELFAKAGGLGASRPFGQAARDLRRRLGSLAGIACLSNAPALDAAAEHPFGESAGWVPPAQSCRDPLPPLTDTALILAYSHEDAVRHKATLAALRALGTLNPKARLLLMHMRLPGDPSADDVEKLVAGSGGVCVTLEGGEQHRHVFHKETLYNKAVLEHLPPEVRFLVFLDADTHPSRPDWLARTRAKLAAVGDGTILQPWSHFADTVDPKLSGPSMSKRLHDEKGWKSYANPGLCVAMTRGCFDSIGGFPTSCPVGAGDTMLLTEAHMGEGGPRYMERYPYFQQAIRKIPKKANGFIEERMVHRNHGPASNRCYNPRHELLQAFWPFGDDLKLDDRGLLAVRPGSAIQYCMARRRTAYNVELAQALIAASRRFCPAIAPEDTSPHFIDEAVFDETAKYNPYWKGRWAYMSEAIRMLSGLSYERKLLEIGPYGLPLARNSVRMGLWLQDGDCVRHDASLEPWPFSDGEFGAVVALQVVEHLDDKRAFFRQAFRAAPWVLVSLPWKWTSGEADHLGIDDARVLEWTGGVVPVRSVMEGNRNLLLFSAPEAPACPA